MAINKWYNYSPQGRISAMSGDFPSVPVLLRTSPMRNYLRLQPRKRKVSKGAANYVFEDTMRTNKREFRCHLGFEFVEQLALKIAAARARRWRGAREPS